eukprot:3758986-Amphidinium_carterae.1
MITRDQRREAHGRMLVTVSRALEHLGGMCRISSSSWQGALGEGGRHETGKGELAEACDGCGTAVTQVFGWLAIAAGLKP